jgi:hypothetical protein
MKSMKNFLLITLVAIISFNLQAQCTDLFISEYVEGNQSNKALELYNPTSSPINLANYQIHRWNNGADIRDAGYTLVLSGTIPAKGTWVLVKDTNATEIVYFGLRNKANAFVTASCGTGSTNRTMCHNGNDAITLERVAGNTVVDIFGQIGIDPGNPAAGGGWNANPASDYISADSSGDVWTTDNTLIRKHTVLTGVTTNPGGGGSVNEFNISTEWKREGFNMFDSLGSHNCNCLNFNSILNPNNSLSFEVYPNPTSSIINIESAEQISTITISGINGATYFNQDYKNASINTVVVNLKEMKLTSGEYLLTVIAKNGAKTTKRVSFN